uniref:VWA domain-containing protein n=1 Tax=Schlesneria paludicola TaxID=360056 RepID=A0A7C2NWR2_9PLAN
MTAANWLTLTLFGAAETADTLTAREFDWPESPLVRFLAIVGCIAVAAWIIALYRKDTAELSRGWHGFLAGLRLMVLAVLLVIALNPQDRTQRTAFRPSRVALLVDTSLSMRHPAESVDSAGHVSESRMEAVTSLLARSPLLSRLQRDHEVSLYTFDAALNGPIRVWPHRPPDESSQAQATATSATADDWLQHLELQGTETRLGEALGELIRQTAGRTLSGIVVLTDGGQNAGIDAATAHERAVAAKARLIAVGVGGLDEPLNVQLVELQAPTDVQIGDRFDLSAFVQAQGLAGRDVSVELLAAEEGSSEPPTAVTAQDVTLPADGVPAEVRFPIQPSGEGTWKYTIRVLPKTAVAEFNLQDNELGHVVRVFDRPTRVLLVAGGPMRDYQFVRNLLHRHKSIEVDVLLQTAAVGTSQESRELLLQFPATREQLYDYDVVIAFDPDWRLIPGDGVQRLADWVYREGGGLVLVAGDVNTLQLASAAEQATPVQSQLDPLRDLYPVVLSPYLSELRFDQSSTQAWPLEFTPEGQRAEFLQLTDDPVTSLGRWKEFPGFYRCYPTSGSKAGATVLARFSDPRSQTEYGLPILMAEQFYGQGRTLYLGSAEFWRLRAVSEDDYDRLWIKIVREVGQGRTKRGTKRGVLLPESRKLLLGQTVRVRARLLDAQFQPLMDDSVPLDVLTPAGKPLVPSPRMLRDQSRPGEFVGEFRASLPGSYRLELSVPESTDRLTDELTVALPNGRTRTCDRT